jgi:hypothetical protein
MFESLFGAETPLAVRFFIAFVVVFGLIGLTAWLVRRFGAARLGENVRGRQPRLAVIEAGAVDGRRRLVLIRRDNVEHLLMIGGPSDIVVEQNIVRGQASANREIAGSRGTGMSDGLPRAVPLAEPSAWPLQPEPAPAPRAARTAVVEEVAQWSFEPAPPPMPAPRAPSRADTLAGLAAELSGRPGAHAEPAARHAPSIEQLRAAQAAPHAEAAAPVQSGDQNLADMAQRLEAALRRPGAEQPRQATRPAQTAASNGASRPVVEAPQVRPEPRVAPSGPSPEDKQAFGSLEEEMASLLGRKG